MPRVPTLIGIGDPFKGEVHYIDQFKSVVIGRSRAVDISVKRTPYYRAQSEREHDLDSDAKTISAKHFQITFYNLQSIEVRNLSRNGTLLDGKPVEVPVLITDLSTRPHEIRFGSTGRFKLTLAEREESGSEPLPLE